MPDIRELPKGLKKFERAVYKKIANAQAVMGATMVESVAKETPQRSGRAAANWSLSDKRDGGHDVGPLGRKEGWIYASTEAYNRVKYISRKTLRGSRLLPVYLLNKTPYIRPLDKFRGYFVRRNANRTYRKQLAILTKELSDL